MASSQAMNHQMNCSTYDETVATRSCVRITEGLALHSNLAEPLNTSDSLDLSTSLLLFICKMRLLP